MESLLLLLALYAVLFTAKKEAAFSNYRFWQSIGFTIGLSYATVLCVSVKLYVLMAVFVVSVGGYLGVEMRERRRIIRQKTEPEKDVEL